MAWVKVSDSFPDHPKLVGVGQAGFALAVEALCYASRHLTDGFVPEKSLLTMRFGGKDKQRTAAELVTAGIWHKVDGGFQIHDFLDYNPSRASILEKRAKDSARKAATSSTRIPDGFHADSRRIPPLRAGARVGDGSITLAKTNHESPTRPLADDLWQVWREVAATHGRDIRLGTSDKEIRALVEMADAYTLEEYTSAVRLFWSTAQDSRQLGFFRSKIAELLVTVPKATDDEEDWRPNYYHAWSCAECGQVHGTDRKDRWHVCKAHWTVTPGEFVA